LIEKTGGPAAKGGLPGGGAHTPFGRSPDIAEPASTGTRALFFSRGFSCPAPTQRARLGLGDNAGARKTANHRPAPGHPQQRGMPAGDRRCRPWDRDRCGNSKPGDCSWRAIATSRFIDTACNKADASVSSRCRPVEDCHNHASDAAKGLEMRSRPSMTAPFCMSSDHKSPLSASIAEAMIRASKIAYPWRSAMRSAASCVSMVRGRIAWRGCGCQRAPPAPPPNSSRACGG
jgi:hypothetical protein